MKLVLAVNALAFFAFGITSLVMPAEMLQLVGMQLNQDGTIEAWAMYGGLELAIGTFLGVCAKASQLERPGLLFAALAFAGLFFFRLVGLLYHGSSNTTLWILAGVECVAMLINFFCLRKSGGWVRSTQ